jgi:hypothetical protein
MNREILQIDKRVEAQAEVIIPADSEKLDGEVRQTVGRTAWQG